MLVTSASQWLLAHLLLAVQVQQMMLCPDERLPSARSSSITKSWRAELAEATLIVEALETICQPRQQQQIADILPYSLFLGGGLDNLADKLAKE